MAKGLFFLLVSSHPHASVINMKTNGRVLAGWEDSESSFSAHSHWRHDTRNDDRPSKASVASAETSWIDKRAKLPAPDPASMVWDRKLTLNLTNRLSNHYCFTKPNDPRALNLMNAAAQHVLHTLPEIIIAYGVSDEFSFVFHRSTQLFERRKEKLISTVVSTFTAAYVHLWSQHFGPEEDSSGEPENESVEEKKEVAGRDLDVRYLPTFDGRAVCYPSVENLRDYLSWRQVDCESRSSFPLLASTTSIL